MQIAQRNSASPAGSWLSFGMANGRRLIQRMNTHDDDELENLRCIFLEKVSRHSQISRLDAFKFPNVMRL